MNYNEIVAGKRLYFLIDDKINELYSDLQDELNKMKSEGIIPEYVELERDKSIMLKIVIDNLQGDGRYWWFKHGWDSSHKLDKYDDVVAFRGQSDDDWLKNWCNDE